MLPALITAIITFIFTASLSWILFYFVPRLVAKRRREVLTGVQTSEQIVERVASETPLEDGEREMIEGVLSLGDLTAADIMIHRTDVEAIALDSSPEKIINIIEETAYSRFPVYDGDFDKIVGILTTRKYLLNLLSSAPLPLSELLLPTHFEPESLRAHLLLERMRRNATHMVIIIDEYGGNSGIVTMENLLEELVGSIYDETDDLTDEENDIVALPDGSLRVGGDISLKLLAERLGIDFDEDEGDADTVGALIFDNISEIPEDGAAFALDLPIGRSTLHVKIDGLINRRVENAIVTKFTVNEKNQLKGI